MQRPFVVCHMLVSLDGKIDGAYMDAPENEGPRAEYGRIRAFYGCQATLYGTTTMLGSYADGHSPALPQQAEPSLEDFLAPHAGSNYIVSLDPKGTLQFASPYIQKKGRASAHVIEVLTQQASPAYRAYLRQMGISYLIAGSERVDCRRLLEKLRSAFGIDRLMLAGGGYTNASFLQEDLIDELSLVIAPLADGNTSSVSIFERADFLGQKPPVPFSLKEATRVAGDGLWLRYGRK